MAGPYLSACGSDDLPPPLPGQPVSRCLGFHKWQAMKWGAASLDCRECLRCGRFEIYAYGSFRSAPRSAFPDAQASP